MVDQPLTSAELPYNAEVMAVPLPSRFKVPLIDVYDGSKDPLEHLETFKAHMTLHRFSREVACGAFPLTLRGIARAWFGSLPPRMVDNFSELARLFLTQFMASRKRRQPAACLLTMKQRDDESLESCLSRFSRERMTTDDQDEKLTLVTLLGGGSGLTTPS